MSDYIKSLESRVEELENTLEQCHRKWHGLSEIMTYLIDEKIKNIDSITDQLHGGSLGHIVNMCSITINPGRQTGKTCSINKLSQKYKSKIITVHPTTRIPPMSTSIHKFNPRGSNEIYDVIFLDDFTELLINQNASAICEIYNKLGDYLINITYKKYPVIVCT